MDESKLSRDIMEAIWATNRAIGEAESLQDFKEDGPYTELRNKMREGRDALWAAGKKIDPERFRD